VSLMSFVALLCQSCVDGFLGEEGEEPKATGTKFGTWDGVGGLAFSVEGTLGSWELFVSCALGSFVAWLCQSCVSVLLGAAVRMVS
jgi:hypothetical protein